MASSETRTDLSEDAPNTTQNATGNPDNTENTSGAGGDSVETSGQEQPKESLEDLVRSLHHQIRTTGWLEQNTADRWMAENPETAKEVERVIAEKKAEQAARDKQEGGSGQQGS